MVPRRIAGKAVEYLNHTAKLLGKSGLEAIERKTGEISKRAFQQSAHKPRARPMRAGVRHVTVESARNATTTGKVVGKQIPGFRRAAEVSRKNLHTELRETLKPAPDHLVLRSKLTTEHTKNVAKSGIQLGERRLSLQNKILSKSGEPHQFLIQDSSRAPTLNKTQSLLKRTENPASANLIKAAFNRTSLSQDQTEQYFIDILNRANQVDTNPVTVLPENFAERNKVAQQRKNNFIEDVESLSGEALENFIYDTSEKGIERFNCDELSYLMWTLRNEGDYPRMVELMDAILEVIDENKNGDAIKECLLFLQNKHHLAFYNQALRNSNYVNPQHTLGLSDALLQLDDSNVEAYAMRGSALFERGKSAELYLENPTDEKNHDYFLAIKNNHISSHPDKEELVAFIRSCYEESAEAYKKASENSMMIDPRLQARQMHRALDISALEKSQKIDNPETEQKIIIQAFLTALTAQAASADNTASVATVRAFLESAYILKGKGLGENSQNAKEIIDNIPVMEGLLLSMCSEINNKRNVLPTINSLANVQGNIEDVPEIGTIIDLLETQYFGSIDETKSSIIDEKIKLAHDSLPDYMAHTYHLGGVNGIDIAGNYRFRGVLPATKIGEADILRFKQLVQTPVTEAVSIDVQERMKNALEKAGLAEDTRLIDIEDLELFISILQPMIRGQLKIEENEMEDLLSEGHAIYDQRVANIQALHGIQTDQDRVDNKDSRTNTIFAWYGRLGDCRHVTHTQNLFAAAWQDILMSNAIKSLQEKFEGGFVEEKDLKEAFERVEQFSNMQLLTFDSTIYSQEVAESVDAVGLSTLKEATNQGPLTKLEEHTFTVIRDKSKGTIQLADAFCQTHIPLHSGQLSVPEEFKTETGSVKGYQVPKKTFLKDRYVNIIVAPTAYAERTKKRVGRSLPPLANGEIRNNGIPIRNVNKLTEKELTALCKAHTLGESD